MTRHSETPFAARRGCCPAMAGPFKVRCARTGVHCSKPGPPMSAMGHSRPSHFVPVLNNVRYASDSDHSRYESELTLWAMNGLMHCNKRRAWVVMILLDHVVDAQQDRDRQFDAGRQVFSMRGPDSYPFHIHRDRREGPYVAL